MTKTWQLRALSLYLTLGLPLAASCAREANTLEGDDTGSGATSASGGSTSKAGANSKAGTTNAFGGTASTAGSGSGGKAGTAGSTAADGGDSSSAGTSVGTSGKAGGGTAGVSSAGVGGGGSGGSSTSMVPADVLARAKAIVYYQTQHTSAMDKTIQMKLFVKNQSPDPLPMDHVKIRYWLTAEVATELHQYYTGPSCPNPKAVFVDAAADSNVTMTFGGGSIAMGSDMNASEVQLEITNNSSPFNQADDFSWNPADSAATPNDKITLYLDDKLIWGCEPSGACFDDGAGTGSGGAAGAGGAP